MTISKGRTARSATRGAWEPDPLAKLKGGMPPLKKAWGGKKSLVGVHI